MSEMSEEQRKAFDLAPELPAIECAHRGDLDPLADRIEAGSASPEERKAVIDLLRRKFEIRRNPENGRSEALEAYEHFKAQLITAFVLRDPVRKSGVDVAVGKFGRSRSRIYDMVKKYKDDPQCKDGFVPMPWRSKYFLTAWSAHDDLRESSLL
jgi:hypothetical protein